MNPLINTSMSKRLAGLFGNCTIESPWARGAISAFFVCAACAPDIVWAKTVNMWVMSNSGSAAELYSIDIATNQTTLVGRFKDPLLPNDKDLRGWSTIAETSDKMLYVIRRYTTNNHVFRLDSNNIEVNSKGEITNLVSCGPTGLAGNLDGLTAGPDGNLYFTAYQAETPGAPTNGLFRFRLPPSNPCPVFCPLCTTATQGEPLAAAPPPNVPPVTELVGTFANRGSQTNIFFTDLAFDPITGDLIGTGFNSEGKFIPWRLSRNIVLNGKNQVFTYVDAFPGWDLSCPDTSGVKMCMEDGLAFDRLTGTLYASGDSSGVYEIDRNTGLIKIDPITGKQKNVGNNADPPDKRGIGTDLAIPVSTARLMTNTEIWVTTSGFVWSRPAKTFSGTVTIVNLSNLPIVGPFQIVFNALAPSGVTLKNPSGNFGGSPYLTIPSLPTLAAGQTASIPVAFNSKDPGGVTFVVAVYIGSF